ncbi:MAG: carboxypeptidase-like regulatory domain-containing protein [Flavobacteriales bacterium]
MRYYRLLLLVLMLSGLSVQAQQLKTRINLAATNKSLPDVLYDIEKNYSVKFAFDNFTLRNIRVTCAFTDTELESVLNAILVTHALRFEETSEAIILFPAPPEPELVENTEPKEKTITIRGQVRSADSRELLPFVNVRFVGTNIGTATNADGRFVLEPDSLPSAELEFTYVGFEPLVVELKKAGALDQKTFYLRERRNYLPAIVILPNQYKLIESRRAPSQVVLNPGDIANSMGTGERDVMRAAQLFPGISATQESSSGLNIRGGSSDQTMVTFDGLTLYHLDHFFGAFSAVNANAVKNIRIIKGSMDAEFGNRTSGIVEINGKEGSAQLPSAQIDLGALSIGGLFESPLDPKGKASILITGRRAFTDALFSPTFREIFNTSYNSSIATTSGTEKKDVTDGNNPDFYFQDVNLKLTYRPNEKDVVNLSVYSGKDQLYIQYADTVNDASLEDRIYIDESTWQNQGVGLRWSKQWTEKLQSTLQAGASRYLTNYFSRDSIFISNTFEDSPFRNEKTTLGDINIKSSFSYDGKYNLLKAGLHINSMNTLNEYGNNQPINVKNEQQGTVSSIFIQDENNKFRNWILKPGVRISHYNQTNKIYPEYRLSAYRISTNRNWTAKFSAGRIHQFIQPIRSQSLYNNNPDYWKLSNELDLPVLISNQLVTGLAYTKNRWTLDLEAYYKKSRGNTVYTGVYGGSEAFVVSDSISSNDLLYGSGYAYGADFLIQYDAGYHHAWAGYSWLTANSRYIELDEVVVPETFEQRHEFKIYYQLESKRWDFSLMWVYGSGRPYTPYLGSYPFPLPDGSTRQLPVYGNLNSARLPEYHRLDASLSYQFFFRNTRAKIQLSCFNVYNRQNIRDIQYLVKDTGPGQNDFSITERKVLMLGFLPSLNLNLRF